MSRLLSANIPGYNSWRGPVDPEVVQCLNDVIQPSTSFDVSRVLDDRDADDVRVVQLRVGLQLTGAVNDTSQPCIISDLDAFCSTCFALLVSAVYHKNDGCSADLTLAA